MSSLGNKVNNDHDDGDDNDDDDDDDHHLDELPRHLRNILGDGSTDTEVQPSLPKPLSLGAIKMIIQDCIQFSEEQGISSCSNQRLSP